MDGGASDIDTFNPKPARGRIQPLFEGIRTSVHGVRLGSEFPKMAQLLNRMVLFRAREASSTDHLPAMQTQLGTRRSDRSNFLQRHDARTVRTRFGFIETPNVINAFPYRNEAFLTQNSLEVVRTPTGGYPAPTVFVPEPGETAEATVERIEQRNGLLHRLERSGPPAVKDAPAARQYTEHRETAVRIIRQAAQLEDDMDEDDIERYCGNSEHATGLGILRAREMIRSGLFTSVLVRLSDSTAYGGWDTHSQARDVVRHLGPRLDRAVEALIEDQRSGILGNTLIVLDTEFGRSTSLDDGGGTGRNHRKIHCSLMMHPSLTGGSVIGDIDPASGEAMPGTGVVNDQLWLELVNEALVVPRANFNFTLRERYPIFSSMN